MALTPSLLAFSGHNNHGLQVANNFGHISNHVYISQPVLKPCPSSTVPFPRDPDFIDRDAFANIVQKCSHPGSRTALIGLGGVGKSQLAIEYCYQTREKLPDTWVFWVHASNKARFEEGYRKIAERVKPPGWNEPKVDILQLVSNWLSDEINGPWTMILDNADDLSLFFDSSRASSAATSTSSTERQEETLSRYIPVSLNGSILITSRRREIALRLTRTEDDIIDVKPMEECLALDLICKKLGGAHDAHDLRKLLEELDYMPLAISQAAAYIRQRAPRISIAKYLLNLQRGDNDKELLLEKDLGDNRRDQSASNSVIATWQICSAPFVDGPICEWDRPLCQWVGPLSDETYQRNNPARIQNILYCNVFEYGTGLGNVDPRLNRLLMAGPLRAANFSFHR